MKTRLAQLRSPARRSRRSQRGAAMVETVVVVPFFIISFASTVAMNTMYDQRLAEQKQTVQKAWEAGVAGCGTDQGSLPGTESLKLGPAESLPVTTIRKEGFGSTSSSDSKSMEASPFIGAFKANSTTTTSLVCNENSHAGNFENSAKALWGKLQQQSGTLR